MIEFFITDTLGNVVSSGYCPEDQLKYQKVEEGYKLHKGKATPGVEYLKEGNLKKYPSKPSQNSKFDFDKEMWVTSDSDLWVDIRTKRDQLLAETDWTQLPDVPTATKLKWLDYRSKLRNLTEVKSPYDVVWPTKP